LKAVTYQGRRHVSVENVADPIIKEPNDVIIRVTSTAICGSDLHLYELLGAYLDPGDILGHEPMGVVEEVGSAITNLKPGDRVVVPFNISCGHCFFCDMQLYSQCETTQVREYGKGASLFGYTKLYGQVPGGQAEYLRVPHADFGPIKVPDGLPDDRFLYLSDVLPTAWQAVQYADVKPGTSLAVLGLGPIGQMCCRVAVHLGAGAVFGVDRVPERLTAVTPLGVQAVDMRDGDVAERLRSLTGGRGPDAVIDAVGMESHGDPFGKAAHSAVSRLPRRLQQPMMEKAGIDRLGALRTAVDAARRGGTISLSGVYGGAMDPIPMMDLFDKQVQVRMGQANVKRWVDDIIPLLAGDEDVLGVDAFATHHLPLDKAPDAYRMFQQKTDGVRKVVLNP
jgi:threonine dehydrogenase-like Zn-dependent dehydrogenase